MVRHQAKGPYIIRVGKDEWKHKGGLGAVDTNNKQGNVSVKLVDCKSIWMAVETLLDFYGSCCHRRP